MVSPSPRVQHLSYADQAKKAQNIKSTHSVTLNVPSTSVISATNPLSNTLTDSLAVNATVDVAAPADPPRSSSATDATNVRTNNGDTRANNNNLATKALSVVAAHTSSQKLPAANVWSIRKEQLAAARSALTMALAKEIPPASQDVSASSGSTSPQNTLPSITAKSPSTSAPNTSNVSNTAVNGMTSTGQEEAHDPFIVRPNLGTTRTAKALPPPVDDTDSWPEVGKAAKTAAASTHSTIPTILGDSVTRNENDQSPAGMSRKSASLSSLCCLILFTPLSNLYS
jgi:la-related protein 1